MKKTVVIGFLGSTLDFVGKGEERWLRWRPTLTIVQQQDFFVSRVELLHWEENNRLAERIVNDIAIVSPATVVNRVVSQVKNPWDFEEMYSYLFDFAQSYPFDFEREEYLIHITTGTHVAQICWFLLAEAHYLPARLLQTSPPKKVRSGEAVFTTLQPNYEIIDLDLSRYNRILQRFQREQADKVSLLKSGIETANPAFNRMIEQIERVSERSKAPMLLMGPTGSGKSFLVRQIYALKQKTQQLGGAFIEVNCATLRGDTAMSTLFGHVKGAFTGAQTARTGLLKAADKGLLFLDEIGELGLDEQAMLLKAIEEKKFYAFGADVETRSDFQLIAGTHRDLKQRVADNQFREDLYARINLWSFVLPSLAERPEDIPPNLDFELQRFADEYQQKVRFNTDARAAYLEFATSQQARWHGNFREFSASVTRMATLAQDGLIDREAAEEEIARLKTAWDDGSSGQNTAQNPAQNREGLLAQVQANYPDLDLFEQLQLGEVIAVCLHSANLSDAGRRLFSCSRLEKSQPNDADRLRKYLGKYGLNWQGVQDFGKC
jgi:transcriptional regulatory protein RtcR